MSYSSLYPTIRQPRMVLAYVTAPMIAGIIAGFLSVGGALYLGFRKGI